METLIVGYGNPMRSDDDAGPQTVRELERSNLPGVQTKIFQQLNIELADELADYDRIILVDASQEGPEVRLREVDPTLALENISSHYFKPELLLAVAQKIYGRKPQMVMCSIQGENFEFGSTLSEKARSGVAAAVRKIEALVRGYQEEQGAD